MFHLGILMVIAGHVVGLLIPREWLYAIGINEEIYHFGATALGTFAAALTLAGLGILIYRRRTVGPVFLATTVMDKIMYVFLGATLAFGTAATVMYQVLGGGFHYRETISPWIRSILIFQPDVMLMNEVPVMFQIHVIAAFALFALWPFTRLVHVFSAPIGYLFRPYIVYRSRDANRGARAPRRGWDPVQQPDPEKLRRL
jgi:nitrate reductase gamma subunit